MNDLIIYDMLKPLIELKKAVEQISKEKAGK